MIKHLAIATVLLFSLFSPSIAQPVPPVPARIGGTLTIVNTVQVRSSASRARTDVLVSGGDYRFVVYQLTADGVKAYEPAAEDNDGLNHLDYYVVDIPIYHPTEQPDGAIPGEPAVIRVYRDGTPMTVTTPPGGRIIVGNEGSSIQIDLTVQTNAVDEILFTEEEVNRMIEDAVSKWDAGGDGLIGLPEAIRALMVVAGVLPPI